MANIKATGGKSTIPLTTNQVRFIIEELKDKEDFRMIAAVSLMFRCVRIGDVLRTLKIENVFNLDGSLKSEIKYTESKTKKVRIIPIDGDEFIYALKQYYSSVLHKKKQSAPLFYAEKLINTPLSDAGVKFLLNSYVGKRNIKQCSPHSFRKAGARAMHENGVSISVICNVLNHHSQRTTEIYIGITSDDVAGAMKCLAI